MQQTARFTGKLPHLVPLTGVGFHNLHARQLLLKVAVDDLSLLSHLIACLLNAPNEGEVVGNIDGVYRKCHQGKLPVEREDNEQNRNKRYAVLQNVNEPSAQQLV